MKNLIKQLLLPVALILGASALLLFSDLAQRRKNSRLVEKKVPPFAAAGY